MTSRSRLPALALAFSLLTGCATLTGTSEILSVDSNPRGVAVYDTEGAKKLLGRTPFFLQESRARQHELFYEGPRGERYKRVFDCQIRWPTALLGNGLVTAASAQTGIGLLVGGALFGVDFFTGAAWTCDQRLAVAVPWQDAPPPRICRKYLVIPPQHFDEKVSDLVAQDWIERRRRARSAGNCDQFVRVGETRDLLDYLNIDHEMRVTPATLGPRNLKALGLASRATDIVFLDVEPGPPGFAMARAVVRDLHTNAVTEKDAGAWAVALSAAAMAVAPEDGGVWLIKAVNLLPNAVSYGVTKESIRNDQKSQAYRIDSEQERHTLPTYLSGWSLLSVDHPDGFDPWDVHVGVSPEVTTGYISRRYGVQPLGPDGREIGVQYKYDMDFFYLAALYDVFATLHTPFGAFGATVGVGPAFFDVEDDFARARAVAPIYGAGFDYTAFLTRDIFFRADTTYYGIVTGRRQAMFEHELMRVTGFTSTRIGIGYFLPQMRRFARDLL